MTRIALIGPGAVGGSVAAWLAQRSEVELVLCLRTPFDRLVVETPDGPIEARAGLLTDPGQAGTVDWVLIATKAYDAASAGPWLERLIGPKTRVAVLQNGVEHVDRFAPYVPKDRIVPAVVDIPAERDSPGRIRQRRYGSIVVPEGANGDEFVALFDHSPIAASTDPDWLSVAWAKLCLNSAGAVSALTLKPSGVSQREPIAGIMRSLVEECAAVGRAVGACLPEDIAGRVVAHYRASPPDSINSLHADRMAGRAMEVDARNGVIVRLGRLHGVPTPVNAMVVALLEAAADNTVSGETFPA
jgi:2-dehydropantoate 2-reductase